MAKLRYISIETAASLLKIPKKDLEQAYSNQLIKGAIFGTISYLDIQNLVLYCKEQKIDSKALKEFKLYPENTKQDDIYYGVKEVASAANLPINKVQRLIRTGKLEGAIREGKKWKIPVKSVTSFLNEI